MISIKKAELTDLPKIGKLLRRVETSASYEGINFPIPKITEEDLPSLLEKGDGIIIKEKNNILGFAYLTLDVCAYFYPITKNEGQLISLINKTDCRMAEDVLVLAYLGVDPLYREKRYGETLLHHIYAKYPRFLILTSLDLTNERGIQYLRNQGFKRVDVEDFEFIGGNNQQLLFKRL